MTLGRIFAIGLAFITAMSAGSASAQFCDDRFPWTCQGPGAPMTITPAPRRFEEAAPAQPGEAVTVDRAVSQYAALYGSVSGERFPIPAVSLTDIHPEYLRKTVFYPTHEQPGTIVIDPRRRRRTPRMRNAKTERKLEMAYKDGTKSGGKVKGSRNRSTLARLAAIEQACKKIAAADGAVYSVATLSPSSN